LTKERVMRENIQDYSKEAIKARMLSNAAKIWGLKSTTSVDPFVKLLIDAFSAELFRINNEVESINTRILEKLAKLLTPSIYTYPQTAHAIGFTLPIEPLEILPEYSEFLIQKQFSSSMKNTSDIQVDIPFTPIGNIRLVKMNVSNLFIGNTCFGFDEDFNKIPVVRIPKGEALPYNKIVMGIDISDYEGETLPDTLSFYSSNPTFEHLDFVFKLLPYITIKNNGQLLNVTSGLTYQNTNDYLGYEEIFKEYSIRTKIEENINNIYRDKFIEIKGTFEASIENDFPKELLGKFSENKDVERTLSGKRYVWLEIEFPPQYTTEILENFTFILNAFPIYNRGWRSNESSLDIMGNNIPLHTQIGEHFLYVENVVDGYGNKYDEIPFSQSGELKRGLYTVRAGGMERFSERNAVDMIANVIELTRDEVSAFGILERDKVSKALANMTQQMKILEQKVAGANRDIVQQVNYVIVDLVSASENLRADYWITHCDLANNIRSGTKLMMQKRSQSSIFRNLTLLTETRGGNDEQKGTDAIQAYKYALTTRDKIITMEDVKNFCRFTIKEEIKSIEVKRGIAISNKPKEGFIRTIEIEIVPQHYGYYGENYWKNYSIELKKQIEMRAIDGIEYIIKVMNKDEDNG
jgi:hypothetical protein